MHKLFRKAFVMVWLAMTGSILFMFAMTYVTRTFPVDEMTQERQVALAFVSASTLLKTSGPEATASFLQSMEQDPFRLNLRLKVVGGADGCLDRDHDIWEEFVVSGSNCYLVSAEKSRLTFVARNAPKLVPWASALLAAAIAAFWLARYLTSPVEELKIGLRALARGQFETRIGSRIDQKRDEVAALAHDFDLTAARLQAFREVQQRLFHDVSHELRSPLSRLQAAIGVIRLNPSRLEAMVERLEREIGRMDDLVGQILTLARLTASEPLALERQTVDLIDLVREIIDDSMFESAERQIGIDYAGVQSCVASVNGELIYRAVENVVRNAVKYSPPGSTVDVHGETAAGLFILTVRDEGSGIADEALESMFRPFMRGIQPTTDAVGFGLGLSITKQAFEWHGGSVKAERGDVKGLVVSLILPITRT